MLETRARLLDAAERQFAERGYEGASLRQITTEAAANLAAVNYHFGDKEALYVAVFQRRVQAINRTRMARLAVLEQAGGPPTVRDIVHLIIDPMRFLWLGEADGQPHPFLRCMARTLLEPPPFMHSVVQTEFGPLLARLLPLLLAARPGLDREQAATRLQAMMGTVLFTGARLARLGPAGPLTLGGLPGAEAAMLEVTEFCVAGLGAPTR